MKDGKPLTPPGGAIDRRSFFERSLWTFGAGAGLALAGCGQRQPRYIVPYLDPPDDVIPGIATWYRSVCRACPASCGVTARVREGRAVKLEGNPEHPLSRGALCLRGQASIEELYAPERLTAPATAAGPLDWKAALQKLSDGIGQALSSGKKVAVLTRPEPSAVGELLGHWLEALGQGPEQLVVFDPAAPVWMRDAARLTFGVDAQPVWALSGTRVVLSLGADLVEDWGSPVELARDLADLRARGRFVYAGPRLSLTAAAASERLSIAPGEERTFALALLGEVLALGAGALPVGLAAELTAALAEGRRDPTPGGVPRATVVALARALAHDGPGLVIGPGRVSAGADAVALAQTIYLIDVAIGAFGRALRFFDPGPRAGSLDGLVAQAEAGQLGALVIHHADPLGYAPALASLTGALKQIPFVATIGNRLDDTARAAHLVLADHHFLESWDEVTVRPGVRATQQPVMRPLHDTRAAADMLLDVARQLGKTTGLPDGAFDALMQEREQPDDLARGGVFGDAQPLPLTLTATAAAVGARGQAPRSGLTLLATPSLRHLDGKHATSALVLEVPDPLTTVAWIGWIEVHPARARELSIVSGDVIRVTTPAGSVELAAEVTPSVRPDVVAVPLPHALPLMGGPGLSSVIGPVELAATGRHIDVPRTGGNQTEEGRSLAREVKSADPILPPEPRHPSFSAPPDRGTRRWALAVDLDRCNGCGACVAACYVENNNPIVGAEEVARGRDMSWLHLQRFFAGPDDAPRATFLPVMCQQCADAPCEPVCPAYATYHTAEGLNAQIYNRCVGTRFCSNNCPYSARRFNWFDWPRPEPAHLALNPDVTVRERGVMEKCTFCVQRIRSAEEEAKLAGRALKDGDVTPACQATCPTGALVFGDLMDPTSRVAALSKNGRAYHLLEELNTAPGVVYLARRREEEPT